MRELKQNWLDLFSAFRIAADPKKMLLGFVAVFLSVMVFWGLTFVVKPLFPDASTYTTNAILDQTQVPASVTQSVTQAVEEGDLPLRAQNVVRSPIAVFCERCWAHLMPNEFGWAEMLLIALTAVLLLLVWAIFGGAISRSAAVEFCRDDRIDVNDSWRFAGKKYWGFFWAPLVPLIGIVTLKACIWIAGMLAGLIPWLGPIVFGLFFFLVLLAAFLIVLLLIGGVFGLPLMFPTVAVEGTDAFDAVSRAFSYVYGRPWKYIWYKLVSIAYGAVCVAFVLLVAFGVLVIGFKVAEVGFGAEDYARVTSVVEHFEPHFKANFAQTLCGGLLLLWSVLVCGLAVGFCVSLCFTFDTIIYCLLRKDVDGTDMTEVYLEEEEEELPIEEPVVETPAEQENEPDETGESAEETEEADESDETDEDESKGAEE